MTAQKKTTKPTRREAADETTSSERLTALVPLHRNYERADALNAGTQGLHQPTGQNRCAGVLAEESDVLLGGF
jgi:hypothetical protein